MSYILVLDVGTTNIKAFLFDKNAEIVSQAKRRQNYITNEDPGQVEQNPKEVWDLSRQVIEEVMRSKSLKAADINSLGLSTYRASFLFWDKNSGKTYSNINTWQDNRAAEYALKMTNKFGIKLIRAIGKVAYPLTKNVKMLTASMLKFDATYASARTGYFLEKNPEIKKLIQFPNTSIVWGTIDSWILWNLTKGKIHATDYSNASATGLLDPFKLTWNTIVLKPFKIPKYILPELKETQGDIGTTDLFGGGKIPIKAIIADQQASLFGQCCFNYGDMKVTNGTGSFSDLNTGDKAYASKRRLYPLVAWVINGQPTYLLEGLSHNTGNIIDWIQSELGLFKDPAETEKMALSVNSTEGVYFLPTFTSGISFPYWSPAKGTLFGLTLNTKKEHIIRAVLEGICFRIKDIVDGIIKDTNIEIKKIKADGGVSRNKFVLQFLADILGIEVERSQNPETTALGAAFVAGLATEFWKSKEELTNKIRKVERVFVPKITEEERNRKYECWGDIINRSLNYQNI
ncbi:MAG TPA: FGGY family carbohydrate kinase [Candidatus Lokiarchaeia archaeon]